MLVSAVVVTVLAVATGTSLRPPDASDLAWVVLVALVPGLMGHLAVAWSHRSVEAWLGSLMLQSVPVIGSIAAWVLLDERISPLTAVGGAVVLGATGFIVMRATMRVPADPEPETIPPAG
jgi:drug/metabolite transporter (DMT)-like permease